MNTRIKHCRALSAAASVTAMVLALAGCGDDGAMSASVTPPPPQVVVPPPAAPPSDPPPTAAPPPAPPPAEPPPTEPPPPVPPPAEPPPPPVAGIIHGRYIGRVTIDGVDRYGDAILTIDGALRLYVGADPYSAAGPLGSVTSKSVQFVGDAVSQDGLVTGSGVVIAQGCAEEAPHRFCGHVRPATLIAHAQSGGMTGDLEIETDGGVESWVLELGEWENYYRYSARTVHLAGILNLESSEFPVSDTLIMDVSATGQLFFQSASSGCTGNGAFTPHLDGSHGVFDVELTLQGCRGSYAYLNGNYTGLAATSASNYWDYDEVVMIWLTADVSPIAAGPAMTFAAS